MFMWDESWSLRCTATGRGGDTFVNMLYAVLLCHYVKRAESVCRVHFAALRLKALAYPTHVGLPALRCTGGGCLSSAATVLP
jgi:hypothetical protein